MAFAPPFDPQMTQSQEQQQELLMSRQKFAPPPTSMAHFADRVESGGAKIEETLSRLNCSHSTLFFVSGWLIIFVSLYSFVASLFSLSMISLIQSIFLLIFGFAMMILDVPGAPRWADRPRTLVNRQIKFLTRVTGKSLWAGYLGCMVLVSLWPAPGKRNGFILLVALVLSSFVLAVASIGFIIGIRRSLRLERIRQQILLHSRGNLAEVYRTYAVRDAEHGLSFDEFNGLCNAYSQGRCHWTTSELSMIFNALDEHQKGSINAKEFTEWVGGSITYL